MQLSLEDVSNEYIYHCIAKGFTQRTMRNKKFELRKLQKFLNEKRGVTDITSITVYDLKAYFRLKVDKGNKATSIITLYKLVHAFFQWVFDEKYLTENLMDNVECPKMPKTIIKTFDKSDVKKMIEAYPMNNYVNARNRAILSIFADCGLRTIEIRRLMPEKVKNKMIYVNGKGNKERVVFISPALKRTLIKYERFRNEFLKDNPAADPNYFLNYRGNRLTHEGVYQMVREAGKKAHITGKRVSPHNFRHFYSVEALKSGRIDLYSLSRLLGHASTIITERYLRSLQDNQLIDKAIESSPLMNLNKKSNQIY